MLKRFPNLWHHAPKANLKFVMEQKKKKKKDSQPNQDIREMFQAAAQKKSKKNADVINLD